MDLGKITEEYQLEKQSKLEGEYRVNRRSEQLSGKEHGSQTPSGKSFVGALLHVVETQISIDMMELMSTKIGRPGHHKVALEKLQGLEPSAIAAVGLKAMINRVLHPSKRQSRLTHTTLSIYIGKAIEDEINIRAFEEANEALYAKVHDDLKRRSAGHTYARRKLRESAKKDGVDWQEWSDSHRLQVGSKIIDVVATNSDILVIKLVNGKNRKDRFVSLADYALEQMRAIENIKGVRSPKYYPMITKPRHWTAVMGKNAGGFLSHHLPKLRLVKAHQKSYLEELQHFDMSEIFRSVNALQDTAWKINPSIKHKFNYLWEKHLRLGKLPVQDMLDEPPRPFDIETNEAARKEWRKAKAIYHTEKQSQLGLIAMHDQLKTISDKFVDEPDLHFVHTVDFRSRAYPKASYLQPQGNDVSRSLLMFADSHAKNLDANSAKELALYGASLFGYDKVSLQDRLDWVEEHTPEIIASAENCYDNRFWCEPSKPFLFLAFCEEWRQWKLKGEDHKSSLPIMRDGTCNGIQHWAAILRDPQAAKLVNMTNEDLPQDAYQAAADVLQDLLYQKIKDNISATYAIGSTTGADVEYAKGWLDYGLDRGLMKKPTMTLTYGSTQYAMMSHDWQPGSIEVWVNERYNDKGIPKPFNGQLGKPIAYLSKEMTRAMNQVVGPIMRGMDFLKDCARVCVEAEIPVTWVTPSNFYVRQAYPDYEPRRVTTKLLGDIIKPSLNEEVQGKYNNIRMVNAVAANFVHSLDATAMYKTINKALDRGVTAFCMIHDSYGTVAADTETLSKCTREAFVELYENQNYLESFLGQLGKVIPQRLRHKLPEVPELGTFNIKEVLESKHFFS